MNIKEPIAWYLGCVRYIGIFLLLPVIAFPATFYGLAWATGIANFIGQEHEQDRFKLLALTPSGAFGANRALALGYLYRHITFRNINMGKNLMLRIGLLSLPFFLFATWSLVFLWFGLPLFLIGMWIDHMQATALTLLCGILAPTFQPNAVNAQLFAFTLYIATLMITWFIQVFIGSLLPVLIPDMPADWVAVWVIGIHFVVYISVRELALMVLWRLLKSRLNDAVVSGSVRAPLTPAIEA